MNKIANTTELKTELTRLAAICVPGVSREAVAAELRGLADRLAAGLPKAQAQLLAYIATQNAEDNRPKLPPIVDDEREALYKKGLIRSPGGFAELTAKGEAEYKRAGSPKVKSPF